MVGASARHLQRDHVRQRDSAGQGDEAENHGGGGGPYGGVRSPSSEGLYTTVIYLVLCLVLMPRSCRTEILVTDPKIDPELHARLNNQCV